MSNEILQPFVVELLQGKGVGLKRIGDKFVIDPIWWDTQTRDQKLRWEGMIRQYNKRRQSSIYK